jgi:hypothetical protein
VGKRRIVRVAPSFFERLDELLPEERSVDGIPSTADFLLHDLPPIIESLADSATDVTTPIPDVAHIRVSVTAGMLVGFIAVYVSFRMDGSVDVLYLDIDRYSDDGTATSG